jgi:hypothetical protein
MSVGVRSGAMRTRAPRNPLEGLRDFTRLARPVGCAVGVRPDLGLKRETKPELEPAVIGVRPARTEIRKLIGFTEQR